MADPTDPNQVNQQTDSEQPAESPDDAGSFRAPTGEDDPSPDEALDAAAAAVNDLQNEMSGTGRDDSSETHASTNGGSVDLPEFEPGRSSNVSNSIDLLSRVNLNVRIELGRTRMLVEDVLRLNEGSVVELDKLAGDPVDVYVNDRLVAYGEVLVLNDSFSVRINEIVGQATSPASDSDS